MATATARLTLGTLLGTVGVAANSITAVFSTTVKVVDMADGFVSDALTRQQIRSVVDMENFEAALQEEKAQEMAERKVNVLAYCAQSTQHEALYAESYDRIGSILATRRARLAKAA